MRIDYEKGSEIVVYFGRYPVLHFFLLRIVIFILSSSTSQQCIHTTFHCDFR